MNCSAIPTAACSVIVVLDAAPVSPLAFTPELSCSETTGRSRDTGGGWRSEVAPHPLSPITEQAATAKHRVRFIARSFVGGAQRQVQRARATTLEYTEELGCARSAATDSW